MSSHHCISSVSAQRQSVVKHIRSYVFDDINQIIDIDVIDFEQYFKTVLYGKICTIVERVCVQHDIKSYNVNVSLKKFDCLGKILKKENIPEQYRHSGACYRNSIVLSNTDLLSFGQEYEVVIDLSFQIRSIVSYAIISVEV